MILLAVIAVTLLATYFWMGMAVWLTEYVIMESSFRDSVITALTWPRYLFNN